MAQNLISSADDDAAAAGPEVDAYHLNPALPKTRNEDKAITMPAHAQPGTLSGQTVGSSWSSLLLGSSLKLGALGPLYYSGVL